MKQKILIVDDEYGIVDMMKSYFQARYEVLTAYSGKERWKRPPGIRSLFFLTSTCLKWMALRFAGG